MNIVIRHLEASDSQDIFSIYSEQSVMEHTSQVQFLSSDSVQSLFSRPDCYTLVAEKNSKVVGHISLFMTAKARLKHSASIAIAVHPSAHGQGVGKTLMREAINQADNWLNIVRLELEVHSDNLTAIALYERMNFLVEGKKRLSTFKAGQYFDTLLMSRISPRYDQST